MPVSLLTAEINTIVEELLPMNNGLFSFRTEVLIYLIFLQLGTITLICAYVIGSITLSRCLSQLCMLRCFSGFDFFVCYKQNYAG